MSAVYATVAELKAYATQYQRTDEMRHEVIIPPASRMVDRLCGVPDGYFDIAGSGASERKFTGSGTRRLRVTPYACDSIQFVEYTNSDDYTPDFVEQTDSNGTHWLVAEGGYYWCDGAQIAISAAWGFPEIPDDIKQATIELALIMWRQRDPSLTKVLTDINGQLVVEAAIPARVKAICAEWKKRNRVVFA